MPYYNKRRYYKRRYPRRYKKRYNRKTKAQRATNEVSTYWKTAKTVGQAAWTGLKIANQLRAIVNVEKKYKDQDASAAYSNTTQFLLINGMAKGDDEDQRDALSILMQSLQIKGQWIINASANATIGCVWLILDKEPKGVAPTAAQIWDDDGNGKPYLWMRNRDYSDRFVILKKWMVTLTDSGDSITAYFQDVVKLGVHAKYLKDENHGDIQDLADNSLYLAIASNEPTNTPTLTWNTRLTFTDN